MKVAYQRYALQGFCLSYCHFTVLKLRWQKFYDYFQSEKLKFYTMSVLRPENNSTDVEDIVFLYRYIYIFFLNTGWHGLIIQKKKFHIWYLQRISNCGFWMSSCISCCHLFLRFHSMNCRNLQFLAQTIPLCVLALGITLGTVNKGMEP